jgi:hypothetical protein
MQVMFVISFGAMLLILVSAPLLIAYIYFWFIDLFKQKKIDIDFRSRDE